MFLKIISNNNLVSKTLFFIFFIVIIVVKYFFYQSNAVDFGELNSVTSGGGSTSDGSRAVYAGGDGTAGLKTYYQIGSKSSSIEWGDLDFEFAGVGVSGPAGAVSGG